MTVVRRVGFVGSLLATLAVVMMWVRSVSITEGYSDNTSRVEAGGQYLHRIYTVRSGDHAVYVAASVLRRPADKRNDQNWHTREYYRLRPAQVAAASDFWKRKFGYDRDRLASGMELTIVAAPYPLLACLTGAPGVLIAARAWRKRRRFGEGLCARCGYDLRASPEQCPECGRRRDDARTGAAPEPKTL